VEWHKVKTLSSSPSTAKKKKKKNRNFRIILAIYTFFFFGGTGLEVGGFTLAKQVLYHSSQTSSPTA
jgi:hypothetical protein